MSDSWDVERDEVIIFNGSFFKKKAYDIWVSPKVKASHPIKNSEGKPQQLLEVVTKKVPSWKANLRWREDDDLFDEDLPVEPLEAIW